MRAAAGATSTGAARAQTPPLRTLKVGLASRHLQFMGVEDAVAAARDMGFDAIEWGVREGAHIEPSRVAQDLPGVVEKTRKAGIAVEQIITMIQDARSPYVEDILRTCQALGIRYYRGSSYYRYDYAKPPLPQIEALTPRMASLIPLNERYGTVLCYHTHSGRGVIGGNVWDIWTAMKGLDPATLGLNYDSGHTSIRTGSGWLDATRAARPFIRSLALKDFRWIKGADGKWTTEWVAMGEGQVDFDQYLGFFRDTGFVGPVNIHYEHSNLLGTDVGKWKLAMSKADALALMRKDLEFVRAKMRSTAFA